MNACPQILYNELFKNYPDVLSPAQVKEMLGISRNSAYELINKGTIMSVKIGKYYRVPKLSVISFITCSSNVNASEFSSWTSLKTCDMLCLPTAD